MLKSDRSTFPSDWSQDGRLVLYTQNDRQTRWGLWILPLEGDRKPIPYIRTKSDDSEGSFSPDSRWVAHMSDESNPGVFPDVYVAAFTNAAGRTRITTRGGYYPRWRRDGKELFYLESGKLMAVDVKAGAARDESGSHDRAAL